MRSDLITKILRLNKEKKNHHFIFIEATQKIVGPQIILWGEASWWPKTSKIKLLRETPGDIQMGTTYKQRFAKLFAPRWRNEVTQLVADQEIEKTFIKGPFSGFERISTEWRLNGTRVDYTLQYKIHGFLNQILWTLFFERAYNKNIQMILNSLNRWALKQKDDKK